MNRRPKPLLWMLPVLVLSLGACRAGPDDSLSQRYRTAQPLPPQALMNGADVSTGAPAQSTPLEELRRLQAELDQARLDREQWVAERAGLELSQQELRADNGTLTQSCDALRVERDAAELQRGQLEDELILLRQERLELQDQLLAERIQRVRTERELILAKLSEADDVADGR